MVREMSLGSCSITKEEQQTILRLKSKGWLVLLITQWILRVDAM
jgi:hypothetical protein